MIACGKTRPTLDLTEQAREYLSTMKPRSLDLWEPEGRVRTLSVNGIIIPFPVDERISRHQKVLLIHDWLCYLFYLWQISQLSSSFAEECWNGKTWKYEMATHTKFILGNHYRTTYVEKEGQSPLFELEPSLINKQSVWNRRVIFLRFVFPHTKSSFKKRNSEDLTKKHEKIPTKERKKYALPNNT